MVVSPHNALLTQHEMQALKYFLGAGLEVKSLLPSDISDMDPSLSFDLLFVSIHALKDLLREHRQVVEQWNLSQHFLLMNTTTFLQSGSGMRALGLHCRTLLHLEPKLCFSLQRRTSWQ